MKLVDVSQQTRENAAYALKCLCKRHHSFIKEELAKAKSDGSLLSLSDINIESILAKGQVLRGRGKVEETVIDNEIHNKRWLRIQRKLLREKLGLESNEAVSVAAKYTEEYLDLINTPYKWGGRDTIGIDCSALLQLSYENYGEFLEH